MARTTSSPIKAKFWLRVAIVQLQCHQSAQVGGRDYLAEPFVDLKPHEQLPLRTLQSHGIDVAGLKATCKAEYLQWSEWRLLAALDFISQTYNRELVTQANPAIIEKPESFDPHPHPHPHVPHLLVVFPEYSIPFEHLHIVRTWAAHNLHLGPIVFAGTHSLPPRTHYNIERYTKVLHFDEETILATYRFAYAHSLSTRSILPIFAAETSGGKTTLRSTLRLKTKLSPFERTNTGVAGDIETRDTTLPPQLDGSLHFSFGGNAGFKIATQICSEALQNTRARIDDEYQILVIPAYSDQRPFTGIKDHIANNQLLVVFCNDGFYGGSGFSIPAAERGESWWLGDPNNGKLPPGDAILIGDLHIGSLADVTQVNNADERCSLLRLSALVPNNAGFGTFRVAQCLEKLRALEQLSNDEKSEQVTTMNPIAPGALVASTPLNEKPVNLDLRRRVLVDCLELYEPTVLQTLKIQRLLCLDDIDDRLWLFYGDDVCYGEKTVSDPPVGREPKPPTDLRGLERLLIRECIRQLKLHQSQDYLRSQHEFLAAVLRQLQERV